MAATNERDLYFRAAERAFYRSPHSDLLIMSQENYTNGAEGEWKSVNLPVLLVDSAGTVPEATRREIGRRRRANLFIWGDRESIPAVTARELESITGGKVFRITPESLEDAEELTQVQGLLSGITEMPLTPRENFYAQTPADLQEAPPGMEPAREYYQEYTHLQEAYQYPDNQDTSLTDTYPEALPSQEPLPAYSEEPSGPAILLEPLPEYLGLEETGPGEQSPGGIEEMMLSPEKVTPHQEGADSYSFDKMHQIARPQESADNYSFIKDSPPGESPGNNSFDEIIPPQESASPDSHSINETFPPEESSDNYDTENYNLDESTPPEEAPYKAIAKEYNLNGRKIAVWRLPE